MVRTSVAVTWAVLSFGWGLVLADTVLRVLGYDQTQLVAATGGLITIGAVVALERTRRAGSSADTGRTGGSGAGIKAHE